MAAARRIRILALGVGPLIVLGLIVLGLLAGGLGMLGPYSGASVPVESLDIERIVLQKGSIIAYVVNSGPTEVTVAQVFVNDAIWGAAIRPASTIPRLGRAVVTIPYEWVEGEPVKVSLVTSNGFVFSREIEAATVTPVVSVAQVGVFAILGALVGIVPVFLGLAWFPFLSELRARWYSFLLTLTVGILIFLGVDALSEAIDVAGRIPSIFQGIGVLALGLLFSFLGLEMVGERALYSGGGKKSMLALAYLVALGIGLHNLGEGLSIGAAYAIGEIALGAFLIVGFTIHNVTEGLAIIAPIAGEKANFLRHVVWLGLLAGAPTIIGTWIGGFTYSDLWAVLFLGLGVGAILQVVYEILVFMSKGKGIIRVMSVGSNLAGLLVGFMIMYATALLAA